MIIRIVLLYTFIYLFAINFARTQNVFQHISNANVYDYLDELAAEKLIEVNSAVKPFSRRFIAEKLQEASLKSDRLNLRQKSELNFYLKDYCKELGLSKQEVKKDFFYFKDTLKRTDAFFYKDSFFTLSLNPILGYRLISNKVDLIQHRYSGAEMFGYLGNNFGFYASLRDNNETQMLSNPNFLNQNTGAEYKRDGKGGGDYSEMRGGITYSNKWFSIGLIKDHFTWGNNYNGANIFSGRTPSFAHLFLKVNPVKWFEFRYVNGYLVSGIVDSAQSYWVNSVYRSVYHQKKLSANLFTIKPINNFYFSVGNSVIYSNTGNNPVYLLPLFFYKSLDHTYSPQSNNGGQNAQMFFDISSRNIKKIHIYSSFFIDEIAFSRIWNSKKHSNFISGKLGMRIVNLFNKNIFLTGEITRNNPIVYKHYIAVTTFQSNNYNLGHYLKDNSQELYFLLNFKPLPRLNVNLSYTDAMAGNNYPDIRKPNLVWGLPYMAEEKWRSQRRELSLSYELINDFNFRFSYAESNISGEYSNEYSPVFMQGRQKLYSFGMNYGF